MKLTKLGALVAQLGFPERQARARALMYGMSNISEYTFCLCYDAVVFVRYLLQSRLRITPDILVKLVAQDLRQYLDFEGGIQWDGEQDIPAGTAVGFFRGSEGGTAFHAAIAIGGTRIRAVNGNSLGAGWMYPVDLRRVLTPHDNATFLYDNTIIRVLLSRDV